MPYTNLTKTPSKTMPDLTEFMTTEEAAAILGFQVKSIRNMVYNGTLQASRWGRSLLISRKSVTEYLEKTQGMSKNDPRRGKNQN